MNGTFAGIGFADIGARDGYLPRERPAIVLESHTGGDVFTVWARTCEERAEGWMGRYLGSMVRSGRGWVIATERQHTYGRRRWSFGSALARLTKGVA